MYSLPRSVGYAHKYHFINILSEVGGGHRTPDDRGTSEIKEFEQRSDTGPISGYATCRFLPEKLLCSGLSPYVVFAC